LLKPGGIFATTDLGPGGQHLWPLLWSWITRSGRAVVPLPKRATAQAFVNQLRVWIEAGRYVPVIDRTYKLADIADAYRYVQTGQKAGIVVIDVAGDVQT
jgi:NADPH:quinone reductase-like Zn-dependent oxidoreductase